MQRGSLLPTPTVLSSGVVDHDKTLGILCAAAESDLEDEDYNKGDEVIGSQPKMCPGSNAAFLRVSRAHEVLTREDGRRQYDLAVNGSSEDVAWAARLVKEAAHAPAIVAKLEDSDKDVRQVAVAVLWASWSLRCWRRMSLLLCRRERTPGGDGDAGQAGPCGASDACACYRVSLPSSTTAPIPTRACAGRRWRRWASSAWSLRY